MAQVFMVHSMAQVFMIHYLHHWKSQVFEFAINFTMQIFRAYSFCFWKSHSAFVSIFDYNNFKGHLSSFLVNLTKLLALRIGFNEFTADTMSWICNHSGISNLGLEFVSVGNEIPLCFVGFVLEERKPRRRK